MVFVGGDPTLFRIGFQRHIEQLLCRKEKKTKEQKEQLMHHAMHAFETTKR
jgi:hypothetical protein